MSIFLSSLFFFLSSVRLGLGTLLVHRRAAGPCLSLPSDGDHHSSSSSSDRSGSSSSKIGGDAPADDDDRLRCLCSLSFLFFSFSFFSLPRRLRPPRLLRRRRLRAEVPREGGRGSRGRRGPRRGEGARRARRGRSGSDADGDGGGGSSGNDSDTTDLTKPATAEEEELPPRPGPGLGLGRRPPADAGPAVLRGAFRAGDADVALAGVEAAGEFLSIVFFLSRVFFFFLLFVSLTFFRPKKKKKKKKKKTKADPATPLDSPLDPFGVGCLRSRPALGDAGRGHRPRQALRDQEGRRRRGRSGSDGKLFFAADAARGLGRVDARLDLRSPAPLVPRGLCPEV